MPPAAADAGASTGRKAASLAAAVDVAECARTDTTLTPRCSEPASRAAVSAEWSGFASEPATAIEVGAGIKRTTVREISAGIVQRIVVVPVESPMTPTPAKTATPADAQAKTKG